MITCSVPYKAFNFPVGEWHCVVGYFPNDLRQITITWEFEQWATWKGYANRDRFEFRHELEYGLTENLQLGLYLSDWRLTNPDQGETEVEWRTAGAELIYSMSDPTKVLLGAMIEVPSLLFELDTLMPRVDFISVGSNDLLQYLFAADRNNTRVSGRYDPLSAVSLRALGAIAEAARRHAKPLSLCGEMAGRPLEAMALIGLGFRSLSMAPASIGPVKQMLLGLNVGRLEVLIANLLTRSDHSLREQLRQFAINERVTI